MSVKHTTWVWEHSKASGGTLLVALALADSVNYADRSDECWPKRAVIAERVRLTERQVVRCIGELIELGEIERQRTRSGNHYRFTAFAGNGAATANARDADVPETDLSRDADVPAHETSVSRHDGTPGSHPYVEPEVRNGSETEDTAELFAEWLSLSGQTDAQLSPARKRQIKKLLTEEPDVAVLKQALQGYATHVKRSAHPDKRWEISDAFSSFKGRDSEGKPVFGDLRSRINWLVSINSDNGELSTESIERLMEQVGLLPDRGLRWLDEVRYHLEKLAINPEAEAGRDRAIEAFRKLKAAGLTVVRLPDRPYVTVKR